MSAPAPAAGKHTRVGRRVGLLAVFGVLAPLSLILWATGVGLDPIAAHVAEERAAHALRVAERVSEALDASFEVLARVPADAAAAAPGADRVALFRDALHSARLGSHRLESVFVADSDGHALVWDPATPSLEPPRARIVAAIRSGRPQVVVNQARLWLLVPFGHSIDLPVLAGGVADPRSHAWRRVLVEPGDAATLVELVGDDGVPLLAGEVAAAGGAETAVEAPVGATGLRVRLRGGAETELSDVDRLRRGLVGAAVLASLVTLALALAWGAGAAARNRELAAANAALVDRDRRRADLLRKVISAQEDERRRVARELHDETGQTLASLKLLLEREAARSAGDVGGLDQARDLAQRGLDSLQELMFDLRPAVLDDLGLRAALRSFATRHLEQRGLRLRFEADSSDTRLSPEVETALFRAAQEALKNVARHARAERVLMQIDQGADELRLEIEDDGCGFDPASVTVPAPSGRGLGLLGMRERLELVGGRVEVESAPDQGTRVVFHVPLGAVS